MLNGSHTLCAVCGAPAGNVRNATIREHPYEYVYSARRPLRRSDAVPPHCEQPPHAQFNMFAQHSRAGTQCPCVCAVCLRICALWANANLQTFRPLPTASVVVVVVAGEHDGKFIIIFVRLKDNETLCVSGHLYITRVKIAHKLLRLCALGSAWIGKFKLEITYRRNRTVLDLMRFELRKRPQATNGDTHTNTHTLTHSTFAFKQTSIWVAQHAATPPPLSQYQKRITIFCVASAVSTVCVCKCACWHMCMGVESHRSVARP